MQGINLNNITTDRLHLPLLTEKKVEADVLRLDKIHPHISGNKWFKLRYYLEEAKKQDKKTVVTYGGAWSNHLLATAAVCKINNLFSIGIIRGEEAANLSSTLFHAKELGMQLIFISREDYHNKIIPAQILVYDLDYQVGIYIPLSPTNEAQRAALQNATQTSLMGINAAGTTINNGFQSAGEQIVSNLGKGLTNAATVGLMTYAAQKLGQSKIHLKGGQKVLLKINN